MTQIIAPSPWGGCVGFRGRCCAPGVHADMSQPEVEHLDDSLPEIDLHAKISTAHDQFLAEGLVKIVPAEKAHETSEDSRGYYGARHPWFHDDDGNDVAFYKAFATFIQNSTIHGCAQVAAPGHWLRRVIWTIICIAGFSTCFYLCATVVGTYMLHSKRLHVSFINEERMEYPVITMCREGGHLPPLNQGLVSCATGSIHKCLVEDWSEIYMLQLEVGLETRCYQYQQKEPQGLPGAFGTSFSLDLQLWNHSDVLESWMQYGDYSWADAMKVQIHHKNTAAMPLDQGFVCSPGSVVAVAMSKSVLKKLGDGTGDNIWGNCQPWTGTPYSKNTCVRKCVASSWKQIFETLPKDCGCYANEASIPNETQYQAMAHCSESAVGTESRTCYSNIMASYSIFCHTKCYPPCDSVDYPSIITTEAMPGRRFKKHTWAYKSVENIMATNALNTSGHPFQETAEYFNWNGTGYDFKVREYTKENVVLLRTWFHSFQVTDSTEEAFMDFASALGEVGGLAGLFTGLSAMTFMEFMEFIPMSIFLYIFLGRLMEDGKCVAKGACTRLLSRGTPETPDRSQLEKEPSSEGKSAEAGGEVNDLYDLYPHPARVNASSQNQSKDGVRIQVSNL